MSFPRDISWSLPFLVLVLVTWQPPVTSLKHKNMICDKISECVCRFPTGHSINLTNLASTTLNFNDTKDGLVYYLNPCGQAHTPCSNGSSLCVLEEKTNHTTDLGPMNASVFSTQGMFSPVYLSYEISDLTTEIKLVCSDKPESILLLDTDIDDLEPSAEPKKYLLLQSPEACLKDADAFSDNSASNGLSSGAIFFIVLIVLWCSYILVGAVANHFLRGATGWEMIPHYQFWKNVPTLFMDGFKFVANGCKPPPSYEQI
ncbi:uncharacterized protein LOC117644137 [Thrips palmi]|uniref:Autophagy-related protein 27 n=1 Tax=Thrips palmi TaxID=161013 RepID=A0A6P8YPT9_THRPL|nr:uncharacterized protein LOC117644137 [Thrips palmi]